MTTDRAHVLAFDASTPRCTAVLGRIDAAGGSQLLAARTVAEQPNQASSRLAPALAELLVEAGVEPGQLAAIACGRGPGTFTGTRVALATAMGLCLGSGALALPLSTLHTVAASHEGEGDVLALLDARRGEVYAARVTLGRDGGARTVTAHGPEACAAPEAWLDALGELVDPVAIGPGVAPWLALLQARGIRAVACDGPTDQGLWAATVAAWRRGEAVDPQQLRAVYLRRSYAELGVNTPKRGFVRSPFV